MSRNLAILALLTAMLLWASGYIATKMAFEHYDPMVVMLGRMLVSSLVFVVLFRRIRQFEYRAGDWLWLLIMVLAEPCFYFMFEAMALQYTSAQQAGMVLALLPLLVSLGAWLWLGEALSRQAVTGFLLAITGAGWLSLASEASRYAPAPLLGNLLEFGAVLCAATYILALKRLSSRYSPWFLTALQCFAGTLFFAPMLALPQVDVPDTLVPAGMLAVLYLGLAVNIGAYGLYNLAVTRVTASQSAAFINLIPVFTLVLAWLMLGETLSATQMAASALVMLGIIISQRPGSVPERQLSH